MSGLPEASAATWREIRRLTGRLSGGEPFVVTVEITDAYPVGESWVCALRIAGLDDAHGRTRPRKIHGVDAMQALQLAICVAEAELEADASDLALEWKDGGAYERVRFSSENPLGAEP